MSNAKKDFVFNKENLIEVKKIIKQYPLGKKRSAILPLLDLAQRQMNGWLSISAIEYIANILEMPFIKVYEIVTFYTMFNLKPIGKNHIQICTTTPCWLRGSDKIVNACKEKLGINFNEITSDMKFSLAEVQCLGACISAPVIQVNDFYYENLDSEKIAALIEKLKV